MNCPRCGRPVKNGMKFCSGCGEKLNFEFKQTNAGVPETAALPSNGIVMKKTGGRKKVVAIAAAVLAVIVAASVTVALLLSSGSGVDDAYVFLANEKYNLLTELSGETAIEVSSTKSNDTYNDRIVTFSPNGEYLYYFTKYDSSAESGTLNRVEYGKLKQNSDRNDSYSMIIDSNVSPYFTFVDDEKIIYMSGDRTLKYYNGEESLQIAKDVNGFFTELSDSGKINRLIYYVRNEETSDDSYSYSDVTYSMYGVKLDSVDNKIKLITGYSRLVDHTDFNNIIYTMEDGNGNNTLYKVGFDKESEVIAENVQNTYYEDDKIFYTAENGTDLSFYDLVNDSYAEADAGITEPSYDDFQIPNYEYNKIRDKDASESDFEELYTSCEHDLAWFDGWWYYSMEEAIGRKWGDNSEKIVKATEDFIEKFADTADEDGYIKVTPEVKEALKEINKHANDPEEKSWLQLCLSREQSGTKTDYDAYNEARDRWYEAKDRIELREELKNSENDYPLLMLNCYENGNITTVSDSVLKVEYRQGALIFNTVDGLDENKADIDEVNYVSDVRECLDLQYVAQNKVLLTENGSVVVISQSAADSYAEASDNGDHYVNMYFTLTNAFLDDGEGNISVASIGDGAVGGFTPITDDGTILSMDGATVYYSCDVYYSNGTEYCDLYTYSDGQSKCMAKDIIITGSYTKLYEDGALLAATDYRSAGYEISMINKQGESAVIGEGIRQYVRVNETLVLYIADGDLYAYENGEKLMLKTNVSNVWSLNQFEISKVFYNYNY